MSACWRSSTAALLLGALCTLAVPPLASDAGAQTTIRVLRGDGQRSRRIEIGRHGVTVTRTHSDNDSDSTTVTIGGDFEGGPIVVHGSGGNGIVRLFSDARVGPSERVEGDVVAVFGSVRVEGEVEGSAVAVFGSLDLRRGAIVRGDAVAVGGALHASDGAKVSGQSVQVGFLPLTLGLPGLPLVLSTIVLAWLISLFFGWVGGALFPGRLARVAITSSRRTAASLGLGILAGPLALMSTLLLMVTVIGIPIALFLPFVFVAVVYAGQIAATYVLGCKLTRRRLGEGGVTAPLIAGSLLVASVFGFGAILWETPGIVRTVALFFMLVGVLLMAGLSVIGTGAFLLSRAGTRPADLGEPGGPRAADVPGSVPTATPKAPAAL